MSNKKFVKDYFEEAKIRLELAKNVFNKNRFNTTIRECHIVLEISSKALLMRWHQVVPKTHNIVFEIEDNLDLMSANFRNEFKKNKKLLSSIRREYEKSLYGDSDLNIPPSELYSKEKTNEILEKVESYLNLVQKELENYFLLFIFSIYI